ELPSDIIRNVIAYSDHFIPEMQLVSHLWNGLVKEEYSKPFEQLRFQEPRISNEMFNNMGVIVSTVVPKVFSFDLQKIADAGFKIMSNRNTGKMIPEYQ
ncbi:hypothetical protein PMAYCL1PPCAC_26511, partial [Pristionchus mayeri]